MPVYIHAPDEDTPWQPGAASRAWLRFWERVNREAPLLRIAAHPGDFVHPHVEASLYGHVQRAMNHGREAVTYRDLLPAGTSTVNPGPLAAA